MKFNKLEVYTKALEIALLSTKLDDGLCHWLADALLQLNDTSYDKAWNENDDRFDAAWSIVNGAINGYTEEMPEITRHKPTDIIGAYWFENDESGRQIRLDILQTAIIEAKEDAARKEDWDANHWDGDSSYNE